MQAWVLSKVPVWRIWQTCHCSSYCHGEQNQNGHCFLWQTGKWWLEIFEKKKRKEMKRTETCWCGTHLLYHHAFAPPNLSNPPKSLCKRQKERKRKKTSCKPGRKSVIKNRILKGTTEREELPNTHSAYSRN